MPSAVHLCLIWNSQPLQRFTVRGLTGWQTDRTCNSGQISRRQCCHLKSLSLSRSHLKLLDPSPSWIQRKKIWPSKGSWPRNTLSHWTWWWMKQHQAVHTHTQTHISSKTQTQWGLIQESEFGLNIIMTSLISTHLNLIFLHMWPLSMNSLNCSEYSLHLLNEKTAWSDLKRNMRKKKKE